MKKTEAKLLGVDTTGLDLQRTKECVTKAYRYATLISLLTMTQLPQADKLYKAMMTRWAKADYVKKLYVTPKWKFVKEVLEILKSKESVEEKLQQFANSVQHSHTIFAPGATNAFAKVLIKFIMKRCDIVPRVGTRALIGIPMLCKGQRYMDVVQYIAQIFLHHFGASVIALASLQFHNPQALGTQIALR